MVRFGSNPTLLDPTSSGIPWPSAKKSTRRNCGVFNFSMAWSDRPWPSGLRWEQFLLSGTGAKWHSSQAGRTVFCRRCTADEKPATFEIHSLPDLLRTRCKPFPLPSQSTLLHPISRTCRTWHDYPLGTNSWNTSAVTSATLPRCSSKTSAKCVGRRQNKSLKPQRWQVDRWKFLRFDPRWALLCESPQNPVSNRFYR